MSHASSGLAIVTQKYAAAMKAHLTTSLEAVAVRILVGRLITICSPYIPPPYNLRIQELQPLMD